LLLEPAKVPNCVILWDHNCRRPDHQPGADAIYDASCLPLPRFSRQTAGAALEPILSAPQPSAARPVAVASGRGRSFTRFLSRGLPHASGNGRYLRLPPVHKVDLIGQLRVNLTHSGAPLGNDRRVRGAAGWTRRQADTAGRGGKRKCEAGGGRSVIDRQGGVPAQAVVGRRASTIHPMLTRPC
jgi:hypothetical protein